MQNLIDYVVASIDVLFPVTNFGEVLPVTENTLQPSHDDVHEACGIIASRIADSGVAYGCVVGVSGIGLYVGTQLANLLDVPFVHVSDSGDMPTIDRDSNVLLLGGSNNCISNMTAAYAHYIKTHFVMSAVLYYSIIETEHTPLMYVHEIEDGTNVSFDIAAG